MRPWKEDPAVSPVLATIILVAIAVVLAGVVYAVAPRPPPDSPEALALAEAGTWDASERSLRIAAATDGLEWGDVTPLLDGGALTYDGALASDRTWCRETPDGVCTATAAFDPGASVVAGQRIRIHATDLAGSTFELRDEGPNMLLASFKLR